MKINLLFTVLLIMLALLFIYVSDQAGAIDINTLIVGTIKVSKANSINIMEDSSGKEVWFSINSNTVFDNAQSSADLKAGDKVQVNFYNDHGKDIANTITKIETEAKITEIRDMESQRNVK